MTTIIATAYRHFAVMVSDRMVTLSRNGRTIKTHDSSSNKCVIFICRDAVVVFGYTGLAYLEGIPTDQWIAQEIWGAPIGFDEFGNIPMVGGARPGLPKVNQVLFSLRKMLQSTSGGAHVEIAAVGYRYRRGRFSPILIAFDGGVGGLSSPMMRMRTPTDTIGQEGIIGTIPAQSVIDEARAEAPLPKGLNELQAAHHVASVHASIIRKIAARNMAVGPHVMKVMIPTIHHWWRGRGPWQRKIVCQFDPFLPSDGNVPEGASAMGFPSAFCPWVVTDVGFQPAALMGNMGVERNFQGWKVELSQARLGVEGGGVFTSQSRPAMP